MANKSMAKPKSSLFKNPKIPFSLFLILADSILVALIITYVPYTKIDWDAYMSQVSGFLGGERDYSKLEGDTGPLVYPAGFLYIYSAIQFLTGAQVYPAQVLFGFLYIANLGIILLVYVKTEVAFIYKLVSSLLSWVISTPLNYMFSCVRCYMTYQLGLFIREVVTYESEGLGFLKVYQSVRPLVAKTVLQLSGLSCTNSCVPWWALSLLCLSKRVHSIFVLRLFNDCIAMILFNVSLLSLLYQKWHLGLIIFSGAVSVKMNVLLYAPPLLLLMLKAMNIFGVISALAGAAIVQILLGLPFIVSNPLSYMSRAFNLGRVFIHFWSVNFKFVPEHIFISKMFALFLLVAHLVLLAVFANYKWSKYEGGILSFIHTQMVQMKLKYAVSSSFPLKKLNGQSLAFKVLRNEHIVTTMFVGNFIGIVCARSLHYQFYSWYFYTLPYLLWKTPFPTFLRIILFVGVEFCWNVYPSNSYSSFLLLCIHLLILWGLWSAPPEYPYVDEKSTVAKKRK